MLALTAIVRGNPLAFVLVGSFAGLLTMQVPDVARLSQPTAQEAESAETGIAPSTEHGSHHAFEVAADRSRVMLARDRDGVP